MKIDQSWYIKPDGISEHNAAGGVVIRKDQSKVYVALSRTTEHPGYILPKGHVEGGETLEKAARREVHEETGFTNLTLISDLGNKERLERDKSSWKTTYYYLFLTDKVQATPTDPDLHSAEWFPLDSLPEMFWPEQKQLIEENKDKIVKLVKNYGK
jgi:ADP-ribose pyrophosphatase YjhB (NUDIX family)